MADKPAEILLFDFLAEKLDLAVPDDVLFQIELHDTTYQKITKPRGVRISEAVGDLAPGPGGGLEEHDVLLILSIYSRITGKEKTDRQPALADVFATTKAVCQLLLDDSTLGSRVCDTLLRRGSRGYDVLDAEPYAVANIPLIINPSGARFTE